MTLLKKHFKKQLVSMEYCYDRMESASTKNLLDQCINAIKKQKSIIVSGLGKNVPICEKFVGTLISVGIRSYFMHSNSAVHGDLGMINPGDIVIVLSKSGKTSETLFLCQSLIKKKSTNWLITCEKNTPSGIILKQNVVLPIRDEGDLWNLIPNNSSLIFLMFLQSLAMSIIEKLAIPLDTFKMNHPGGSIGEKLQNHNKATVINYVKNENQLSALSVFINNIFSKKIFSLDLDGTLVGSSMVSIPQDVYKKISRKYTTIINSGAGYESIKRKIPFHDKANKPKGTAVFSGPIIANEGAQIYNHLSSKTGVLPVFQSVLSKQAISFLIRFMKKTPDHKLCYGFYPPRIRNNRTEREKYYLYSKNDEVLKKFIKMKADAVAVADMSDFIQLLKKYGAVKFVISFAESPPSFHGQHYFHAVINEGLINITSKQSSKLSGLKKTAMITGIKINPDNLLHFGNDMNDFETLAYSKHGIIIDSNKETTKRLINKLKGLQKHHYLVVNPSVLKTLFEKIALQQ